VLLGGDIAMKRVLFSLGVAIVIVIASVLLFGPLAFGGYIANTLGIESNHPMHPPRIAQGIDFAWPGNWANNPQWNAVLARRFPKGSSEATLQSTLREQGFEIDAPARTARYEWGGMPCLYTLRVDWTAEARKLKAVDGGFGMGCL
jgi:hypothetical protein